MKQLNRVVLVFLLSMGVISGITSTLVLYHIEDFFGEVKTLQEVRRVDICLNYDLNDEAFEFWYIHMKKWEGKYSNHPNDLGGETMKGLTWNTFLWLAPKLNIKTTKQNFLNLSDVDHIKVAKWFWDSSKASNVNHFSVSILMAEEYWGSGNMHNFLKFSSIYFEKQFSDIDSLAKFLNTVSCEIIDDYIFFIQTKRSSMFVTKSQGKVNGKDQSVFLQGWINRINDLSIKISKIKTLK